jgi:hypothetical protein
MIHPKDLTQQHLDHFYAERRERGYSIPSTNQAIAYLKMRIREAIGLDAEFPLLDVSSDRQDPCRLALKNMGLCLKAEVEEAIAWLSEEAAPGIIRMSERTRQNLLMLLEILCGFANRLPRVGTITSLSDSLNRPVITAYARWLHYTGRANRGSIKSRLYNLHAFLIKYPPFDKQDWDWIHALLAEFPAELESEIDARRQERAFDYDFNAIADLLNMMQERRQANSSRTEVEIGWMVHDEFLMEWLACYPLPPRCMYECRFEGDRPNLFRASDKPRLVPDSVVKSKIPHLVSDDMWILCFEAEEVPNRNPIVGPLPDQLARGLIRFLQYRPLLIPGMDPGTLFLNRNGGTLRASTFSKLVGNISESYLGKPIPPSAFRDIGAYRYLSSGPRDYSTLASLLCQSEHSVRMRFDPDYRLAHRAKSYHARHAA